MYGLGYEYGSGYDHHLALKNNGTTYSRIGFAGGAFIGGTATAGGDFRAPIFYDSNNTNYYADPASTSVFNVLRFGTSTNSGRFDGSGTWGVHFRTDNGYIQFGPANSSHAHIYTDRPNFYLNTTLTVNDGSYINTGDIRSAIFYDRNDTGYYIDPASFTEIFGGLRMSGGHGSSTIRLRLPANQNGAGQGVVHLQSWCSEPGNTWSWAGFGYNVDNTYHDGSGPYYFSRPNTSFGQAYMRFSTDGSWYFYNTNTSGTRVTNMELYPNNTVYFNNYATGGNSLRAPIFYDSNDTGRYVDPNGTSQLQDVYSYSYRGNGNVGGTGNASWHPNGIYSAGYNWLYGGINMNGGTLDGVGPIYATIFYDRNNSGYYLDPNSTSFLYHLILSGASYFRPNTWIQFDGNYGLYWPNNYGAHFYPNNGSSYTQLRIDGQKNGYDGIWCSYSAVAGMMYDGGGNGGVYREANGRWYFYYNLGNDCMGIGTSSTSSTYSLYLNKGVFAQSRIDATIFYDTNNTGYYGDFASTSRINAIIYDNIYWAGDTSYGFIGRNVYADTVNGRGGDPLELNYYDGGEVRIGPGGGNKNIMANAFYKGTNTGYYCNPDGYSQLSSGEANNYWRAARYDMIGTGGNSGQGGNAYSIFQEGGGWGFPFPDLRIAYHTGIKMGANAGSYEGIRLYDDYPMSSLLIQLTGSSNYSFWYTWQNLTGYHGIYSGLNSAHIYPNNGSYGSWRIDGSRNGWPGIEFGSVSNGPVSLMCYSNGNETGWHNNSYSWQTLWDSGRMRIAKNTYGGNLATVLDSSNASNAFNLNQGVNTNSEPRFRSNYFYHGSTSRHTGVGLYGGYTMGVWEARSDFEGLSGGESGGIGINGDFMQFWNPGDLFQMFMFSDEDSGTGTYIAYLGNNGVFYNSDRRIKYSIREKVSENHEYIDRFMQLKPVTFAYKLPLKDDDTPKQRERKISKMLTVHQGLIAQDVMEVFPEAIHCGSDTRPMQFELSEITEPLMQEVGISGIDEVEAVKQKYVEKHAAMDVSDTLSLNWNVINTYQILALQDFKKMYDAKCEEIEELKSELALIKQHLGLS
jgi:hypothetical protein